jgi:hypothetical protein
VHALLEEVALHHQLVVNALVQPVHDGDRFSSDLVAQRLVLDLALHVERPAHAKSAEGAGVRGERDVVCLTAAFEDVVPHLQAPDPRSG